MKLFTLANGSYLLLADDAKYEVVSKRMTIQGGSATQEARRLEELSIELYNASAKLRTT